MSKNKNSHQVEVTFPVDLIEPLQALAMIDGRATDPESVLQAYLGKAIVQRLTAYKADPNFKQKLAAARAREQASLRSGTPLIRRLNTKPADDPNCIRLKIVAEDRPEALLPTDYCLPEVTPGIFEGILAEMKELGDDRFIEQSLDRLAVNNPLLFAYATGESISADEQEGIILTHELMRRQGEANQFEVLLNPDQQD